MFQSLLWWIGRVNRDDLHRCRCRRQVSILVVVDWSRQPSRIRKRRRSHPGFQSLLWWIGRVNSIGRPRAPPTTRFQSLLWWIGRVNAFVTGSTGWRLPWFQSLLWWIGRVNHDPELRPCNVMLRVFQSLLWWIGRVNSWTRSKPFDDQAMFQSLLWWIGRVNAVTAATGRSTVARFNPCCGGSVASTRPGDAASAAAGIEVSILVVVDRSRQRGDRGGSASCRCFNPCCGGSVPSTRRPVPHASRTACFNPCCGGSVPSTICHRRRSTASGVSILVVVDRSRQRDARRDRGDCIGCFNPCCGGSVPSTLRRESLSNAVQSLLRGSVSILVAVDRIASTL